MTLLRSNAPLFAAAMLLAAMLLAGCAGHRGPKPSPVTSLPPLAPTPNPANAAPPAAVAALDGVAPGTEAKALATIWRTRVALNVAALACRGGDSDAQVAGYNAMLENRRALLAAAEAALIAEYGGPGKRDGYDRAMTRLYNLYARPGGQARFCKEAARVQRAERSVPAVRFAAFCADAIATLNEPFDNLPATSAAPTRRAVARKVARAGAKHAKRKR